jgi:anthranilate phosphoribosyltransferase
MPNPVLTKAIEGLASRRDLSSDETAEVLAEIMRGEASETQIAAFLIALRTKGETIDELVGLARTMRELATRVPSARTDLLDTAGTGGGRTTFNVSTTAALVAAGAGCAVAKHGNRSATSLSGSADLLEALGARIDLGPEQIALCIEQVGFGFMFAPAHHQATRFVVPVRRELAVRTIFNLLGPLTNPAGARHQLIGVSDASFLETIAGALARLGTDRALVVAGEDGLDEISTSAATRVIEVNGEQLERYTIAPADLGIELADPADPLLAGGTPEHNAAATRAVLEGEDGVRADLVAINSGAALYAAGACEGIAEGIELARVALRDGRAAQALERYLRASHGPAPAQEPARAAQQVPTDAGEHVSARAVERDSRR